MELNDDLSLEIDNIESDVKGAVDTITNIDKKDDVVIDIIDPVTAPVADVNADSSTGEVDENKLNDGDIVELDGKSYTVNANGELLDSDNKVFKTSDELNAILAANVAESDETALIADIQKEIGIEVVDESGAVVVFENTPEGIKSYVNSVLEVRESEIAETVINDLLSEYPIVEQVINHIKLNGSLEGFNERVDRSDMQISKDDESQQIAIIKEEWKSQGKKGSADSYIEYLKTAGTLYDASIECLQTLNEISVADKIKQEAAIKEKEANDEREAAEHWNTVNSIIDSGELLGYKLPDRITVNRDGKQLVLGKNDFKNYISKPVDREGNTKYMIDRSKEDGKVRIEDDLLKAYLKFTGSNYSSLVSMAINKEKIKSLKLSSTNNNGKKTIKLNPISSSNTKVDNNQVEL